MDISTAGSVTSVVSSRRHRPFEFQGQRVRFVTLRPARIYGAIEEPLGKGTFRVSDRERTLVDGLLEPRYCGGIPEVAKALWSARRDVSWNRVEAYAGRLGVDAVPPAAGVPPERPPDGCPASTEDLRRLPVARPLRPPPESGRLEGVGAAPQRRPG